MTCILCPRGCIITAAMDDDAHDAVTIDGAGCAKGNLWAEKEVSCPMRTLCTSIRVTDSSIPLVSVKTDCEVPLESIPEIMKEVRSCCIDAPVSIGQVLMHNPAGIPCKIVATRSTEPLV